MGGGVKIWGKNTLISICVDDRSDTMMVPSLFIGLKERQIRQKTTTRTMSLIPSTTPRMLLGASPCAVRTLCRGRLLWLGGGRHLLSRCTLLVLMSLWNV